MSVAGPSIHAASAASASHLTNVPGMNLVYQPIARALRTAIWPKTFSQVLEEKYFLHLPAGIHALCTLCNPGITTENFSTASNPKLLNIGRRGRTWVAQHMKAKHADILCFETAGVQLSASVAQSKSTTNTFEWQQWITSNNLPLTFVEYEHAPCHINILPMSARTLKQRLFFINCVIKEKLKSILPTNFDLMADSWEHNGQNFCGVLAVGHVNPCCGHAMLGMSTFESNGETAADQLQTLRRPLSYLDVPLKMSYTLLVTTVTPTSGYYSMTIEIWLDSMPIGLLLM